MLVKHVLNMRHISFHESAKPLSRKIPQRRRGTMTYVLPCVVWSLIMICACVCALKQETARALGSRRDRVRHKLKRKSSSRANKDKKVAKETTRSCESQEGDPMAENNPMESTSQLPSFKERFYMDYYRESHGDSRQTARQLFELMITPYPVDKFFR